MYRGLWYVGTIVSAIGVIPMTAPGVAAADVVSAPMPRPVVSHHEGTFNGTRLDYTATVEAIDVLAPNGAGGARVVSFAYTRDVQVAGTDRPVIFLFNGGPIASSLWIHLGAFGPKRVEAPTDLGAGPQAYRLVDNPLSPIDVADLVFIDPADTGFSRRLPGTPVDAYHSVAADGQQITSFIAGWLTAHGRRNAPVYLVGESYGTVRAPEVIGQLASLPKPVLVDGVFLLGQAVNIVEYAQRPGNIISYAVSLPTLAAIAWYHGKVDRSGKTFVEFVDEARRYGRTTYLEALFRGGDLPPSESQEVATRLQQLSGIPAAWYLAHDLRITKEQYRLELLKDRHLLLGRNDARYTALVTDKGSQPDPSDTISTAFEQRWDDYLHTDLGVYWSQSYVPLAEVKRLDDWSWGATSPFADWPYAKPITKLMGLNPKFRLLIGNGYYDTQTTVGAADFLRSQSGWPDDRVALRYYQGGHMAYTVDSSAREVTNDLRALVTGKALANLPEGQK